MHESWKLVRGATGRPVKHHRTYELTLWDGRILRTRISQPVDKSEYPASMWSHILRQQLEVDSDAFWACAKRKVLPDRGEPKVAVPKKSVPMHLYRELRRLGAEESRILELDAADAAALLSQMLIEEADRPGEERRDREGDKRRDRLPEAEQEHGSPPVIGSDR